GVAGIVGAVGTGIVYSPALGGPGGDDFVIASQVWIQVKAVVVAIAWAGIGAAVAAYVTKLVLGLRVTPEVESDGLDIGDHGERAYN
ncbi:MAG TPA: ammonia channel protein, partial [Erythrobacter sp.]|nr:ammonia channel protein [Erythrobacter sp.]